MKNVIFLGVLFINFYCNAQSDFWKKTRGVFNPYRVNGLKYQQLLKEKDVLAENNVQTRTKTKHYKKHSSTSKEEFDKEGRITRIESNSSTPKRRYINEFEYNENGKLALRRNINPKGKISMTLMKYNDNNDIISVVSKGDDLKYHAIFYKYDKNGKKILTENFYKDSIHPITSLAQNYYEDGSRKSTVFKKKGKIKHEWKYDCKPEGELVNVKQKDLSTICVKEERDSDGNRIVWKKEFDEKGKLTKVKNVFKSDSIFVKSERYNLYGRLIRSTEKNEFGGFKTIHFKKNGSVSSYYESFFNDKKQETKYISRFNKYEYTKINKYEDDLKTLEVSMNNKSTSVYEYEYNFY